jgi:hypothetical protein
MVTFELDRELLSPRRTFLSFLKVFLFDLSIQISEVSASRASSLFIIA